MGGLQGLPAALRLRSRGKALLRFGARGLSSGLELRATSPRRALWGTAFRRSTICGEWCRSRAAASGIPTTGSHRGSVVVRPAEELTRPGLAVLAPIVVAPALLYLATSTYVTFVDAWAIPFTMLGIALLAASMRRKSRGLLCAAVAACLLGALLREILVYVMLFAPVSAVLLPRGRRWREVWPWLVGIAAFGAAYAAHVIAVAGRTSSGSGALWMRGGLGHFVATVRYFEGRYGAKRRLLPVLIAAGIFGAVIVWRHARRLGAFLIAVTAFFRSRASCWSATAECSIPGSSWATGESSSLPVALSLGPVSVGWALAAGGVASRDGPG